MYRVIVGLGNPGARYERTRHNIGFRALDEIAHQLTGSVVRTADWREKFGAQVFEGMVAAERYLFVKPMTFMNLSGEPLQQVMSFYKHSVDDLVVVHDEVDLEFGALRLKKGGSEAGHNGLRSISSCLGSREYVRVRLGVGRPPPEWQGEIADWVLNRFALDEEALVGAFLSNAAQAVEVLCKDGLKVAQNRFNNVPL